MRTGRFLVTLLAIIAALTLGLGGFVAYAAYHAPPVTTLRDTRPPEPSVIVSADGKVLGRLQENRQQPVPLDQVSPFVIQALIATEDHRFRQHHGVDWVRLCQAAWRTSTGRTEGGSTLTQQLVRNLFPEEIGRARTPYRKVKEIVTALRIERIYSKDQILEAYLNSVPFLYNAVGIEAAAGTYFGKHAKDLDPGESATLVGMLKGTQYFNPVQHPERARARRNLVLAQMVRQGDLSHDEYEFLKEEPLRVSLQRPDSEPELAPHFAAYVRKWLEDWADTTDHDLARDGLVVHTTLDSRLQAMAADVVARQAAALQNVADVEWSQAMPPLRSTSLGDYAVVVKHVQPFAYFWREHAGLLQDSLRHTPEYLALRKAGQSDEAAMAGLHDKPELLAKLRADKTRLESGFVAIEPATGAVKVWVGSRDYDADQFDHVAQAARQPGSTFKPIVYATAMERGIPPQRTYVDTPLDIPLGDGRIWRPTDMHGSTGQPMTMWEGLVYSKNTITTQVMQEAGLPNVAALAKAMGIVNSPLDVVPSMALGTSPVTLLEMASVYATIASQGQYRQPYFVDRITDRQGRVLAEFGPNPAKQVISVETADNLVDMLRGVVTQGTGAMMRARFVHEADVAGKTGTTQNNTDGWFMAMTPQLVAGAWVGFNDQHVTMRGTYWGQGGHSALLIVGDFLQRAIRDKRLDTTVAFATPVKPPIVAARSDTDGPLDDMGDAPAAGAESDDPVTTDPAGTGTVSYQSQPMMNDKEPPKSAEELGQAMKAMGRDPDTGAPSDPSPLSERPWLTPSH